MRDFSGLRAGGRGGVDIDFTPPAGRPCGFFVGKKGKETQL
jgi:hypothetical protein